MEIHERKKPKILIVDDESFNIGFFEFILKEEGFETESANNGLTAIQKAKSENISLILLDLMMPEMDGYEVIKRLKQDILTRDIPIIFVSANTDESSYIKGIELGALDYFRKPFNKYELVLKIRNYLRLSQLESDLKKELQERKQVEEELIQSESRYRNIIEDQTEFVVRHLPDGTRTFVNGSYCKYLNKSSEELVGTSFFSQIPEEQKEEIITAIQSLTPEYSVHTDEYKVKLPSRPVIWQSWSHRALFDSKGVMTEIQSVGRDISDMKRSEESIRIISDLTAGLSGPQFFNTLVSNMVELLNVDIAFIGEWNKDHPEVIRTSSVCRKGKIIEDFEYELRDTPCANVFGKELCIFPKEIQKMFPKDLMLIDMGIESYAGMPLFGKGKRPIGILVVLHSKPLEDPEMLKSHLKAFSVRAAAELERKKNDEKLLQSEEMFRLSFSHAAIGKAMAESSSGKFIWINDVLSKMLGYSEEELQQRTWHDITHPGYLNESETSVKKLFDGEIPSCTLEQEVLHRAGHHIWINLNIVLIRDSEGQPLYLYADVVDITEKKKIEQALIKNEKRLEMALAVSGAGVYDFISGSSTDSYYSERWFQILGHKRKDLPPEQSLEWYFGMVHQEDRSFVEKAYANFISGEEKEFNAEYRIRKNNGKWTYVQDICHAINRDKKGKAQRIIGILLDINNRKKAEVELKESKDRFQKIFLTSPEIVTINRLSDALCIDVNEAFTRTFGYTRNQCLGKTFLELGVWENLDDRAELAGRLKRQEIISKFECNFITKNGRIIPILLSSTIIHLDGIPHILSVGTNIEKIKEVQKSLEESETKYRLLADYNYDWEYWIDPDNSYIYVSPSCERITGYKAGEFIANPELFFEIIHPDFSDDMREHYVSNRESDHHDHDFKIIDKQGDEKWINHHCSPVYDEQGKYLGRRGSNRDITEGKLAELELRKLSTAIRQSNSSIVITDTDGIIEYVNPFFKKLTGYSSEEALGMNPSILQSGKTDPGVYKELWQTISCGEVWRGEFINRKKNSKEYTEYAIITPVKNGDNRIINYIAVKQDITEQKLAANALQESEKNFRNIFHSSSQGILISSLDQTVLEANESLLMNFGYSHEEIGKLRTTDLVISDNVETLMSRLKKLKEGASSTPPVKLKGLAKSGKSVPVEINSRIIEYSGHKAVLTMVRDITEQEEIQRRILNTIIETEEKERSRFANDLHDGLGPLLSTTKLYIKALASIEDPSQKEIAINKSMVAIDEAISSIKEISNNISPHILRNFGLAAALKTYVKSINDTNEINLEFAADMDQRPAENIELSLFRVVIELLNNTLKYARARKVTILLKREKGLVSLTYADDGIGFDTEKLLNNPTGRGLQNIVNRVKSLDGVIQFSSKKGKGMNVKIEI